MIRRPPRSTQSRSSAASDVYKRQGWRGDLSPASSSRGNHAESSGASHGQGMSGTRPRHSPLQLPWCRRQRGSYGRYEEYKDVSAAARFLKDRLGQSAGIVLGGYSFGAAMSALAVARDKEGLEDVAGLALVAFAVRWEEFRATAFEGLSRYHGPVLALSGEDDPIAPPAEVADFLSGLGLDLREERLVGEDHMLGRSHKELEKHVGDFAATALDEWKGEVE